VAGQLGVGGRQGRYWCWGGGGLGGGNGGAVLSLCVAGLHVVDGLVVGLVGVLLVVGAEAPGPEPGREPTQWGAGPAQEGVLGQQGAGELAGRSQG